MKKLITNQQYKAMRNKPEFVALIKAGRALNSITLAMRLLDESKAGTSHLDQRQARKAITFLAGFCHEGRLLAQELHDTFTGKSYVSGFASLLGSAFDDERKLLGKIRNGVSFHLDHEDKTVKKVLNEIESLGADDTDEIEFYESSTPAVRDFSFAFGDLLDFNYMIIKSAELFGLSGISDVEQREDQSIEKLQTSIHEFSNTLVKALDEFMNGLITELGI